MNNEDLNERPKSRDASVLAEHKRGLEMKYTQIAYENREYNELIFKQASCESQF